MVRVIEWCKTIHSVEFALCSRWKCVMICSWVISSEHIWTHYLESLIEQYWKDLKDFASAMRHCQCENPSLSKMLIDILPKWAGINMPTLVMSMFWFPALVLQWAWAQLSVSRTCGGPACSGMFRQSWMWYQGTLCWAGVNKIFENNDLIFDCLLLWGYPDSFFCLSREEQCTSSIGQWRRVPVHISM